MKKMILKSTLAVVAVTASCLGAWKTYDAYGCVDNSLLMQNIEALTQNTEPERESGDGRSTKVIMVVLSTGTCYINKPTETQRKNGKTYVHYVGQATKHTWRRCVVKTVPKNDPRTDCVDKFCPPEESADFYAHDEWVPM